MEECESMSNIEAKTRRERSQNSKLKRCEWRGGLWLWLDRRETVELRLLSVEAQQRRTFQHVSLFPQSQVSLSYCMQTRLELELA